MGRTSPHVRLELPRGVAISLGPPRIAESAGAALLDYTATRTGEVTTATGCVAMPIPGWVEDMRPAVEGRTVGLAGNVAERLLAAPVDARPDGPGGDFTLRRASDLDGPVVGRARTFIGFDAGRVHSCFAVCAGSPEACAATLAGALLVESRPPPPPGLALAGVTWGVHHPGAFAGGAAMVLVISGVLAVVTRPKPRTRAR